MKTSLYTIVFLLLSLTISKTFAQNFHAGALLGVNASQVSGDNYSGFNKAGLLLGMYSNVNVGRELNLQAEINYSQKGSRRNPNTDLGDTDFFLMRLDYIEVPVMGRWEKNRFTFEAGFYFGQLINEELEDENGPFEIPEQLNQFRSTDLGGLIGFNFNFTDNLIMNWRYSNSLYPVRDHDSGEQFRFNSGMYHSYLSFSFRYEFLGSNDE